MMTTRLTAPLFLLMSLAACAGFWEDDDIEVSEVPVAAIDAARGAVDGLAIRSAESKEKDGRTIYELDGSANGVKYEVKVTAGGEILKVETED